MDFLKMDTPVPVDFELLGVGGGGPVQMGVGPITMTPTGLGMAMNMGMGRASKAQDGEDDDALGEEFTLSTSLMNISLDKDIVDQIGLPLPPGERVRSACLLAAYLRVPPGPSGLAFGQAAPPRCIVTLSMCLWNLMVLYGCILSHSAPTLRWARWAALRRGPSRRRSTPTPSRPGPCT
jgi:hypothetical protein